MKRRDVSYSEWWAAEKLARETGKVRDRKRADVLYREYIYATFRGMRERFYQYGNPRS